MAKRRKTALEKDYRARFLYGFWTGLFAGLVIGIITGAVLIHRNVLAKDIKEIKAEIRITVDEMKLEQIEMDKLVQTIRGWQMEIDEVWLYYGTSRPLRTRAMDSDEGRPSSGD